MAGNLALDSNHDIIIGRGTTRISGAAQVAQLVKCRLLTIFGEWKLDNSLGLPWFEAIFTKQVRPSDIEAAIANIIRGTAGVQQLISIDIDADYRARSLGISFTALSDYGNITEFLTWQQSNTA
ncbi:hypothetical protein QNH05_gp75 [Escherichia phage vB_EcoM_DE15]|uniref:Uncharacterized protein n=1 Tax=Escherichia phage vB_EcoM_DE15 TaxID=3003366 RepID=A0AAE9VJ03_9CAUD|nr:hypothetical protein QNH02_gp56 [Escherichia phage vB_EcoP_Bp7]YP_010844900.1 hypothetical protein QNH03_gp28 [Escherichia phage vB_EcoM_Bp10]YP_010845097.1 hypothetical protein QNH05_gp75 [Escherichia phage vB_EcoM_DE15]QDJ96645.1 hypothetical protein vBEcoP_Bp764 [Escherichia phage vB_EcoP_Bp7]QEM42528.1 hypothetical protein vBEcoMBp10_28 [Escherichia phage vB_EcoM_Bp10]WAX24590.1 hypothetical protein [Escherichia phage vB_EcoM_DE15]